VHFLFRSGILTDCLYRLLEHSILRCDEAKNETIYPVSNDRSFSPFQFTLKTYQSHLAYSKQSIMVFLENRNFKKLQASGLQP
jgi:hypothetical protein